MGKSEQKGEESAKYQLSMWLIQLFKIQKW
jgi:hypothetical protein